MTKKDTKYWVGFSLIPRIGRLKLSLLESHLGDLKSAWQASPGELKKAGLDKGSANAVNYWRDKISLDADMEKLGKYGVKAVTFNDPDYPARLKEIYDYPPVLYIRGKLLPQDEWCLAVVGTRRSTVCGRQAAEELATDLARNKITIVSGLARGIDSVAHQSALRAGGRTIAIAGCGLDIVYPAENAALAREFIKQGALISEFPLGTRPKADNFPRRNRILSGLSLGMLVIEADETSGAMITAHLALEQNREVFAVPGSILSPASWGTNRLIQEGAKMVRSYTDILEELNLTAVAQQMELTELLPTSDTETLLLKQLSAEPTHIDEVCRLSGLPVATVSGTLSMMELKGLVKQTGTINYILSRETRETYRLRVD